jgi:ADP-ribosylglycohydrolase
MLGAIAGDVIGSVYEWDNISTTHLRLFGPGSRFTDDTVLTVAVADALLTDGDYAASFKAYHRRYPDAGYGGMFRDWARSGSSEPYGSFGNGSAMRVSPVGYAFATIGETLDEAARSAWVTHDHPEGIKGAQAVASAIFWARTGRSKDEIREAIRSDFGYPWLDEPLAEVRARNVWDATCPGSVPQAIAAFLHSRDFEDAVRTAVSLGGDSDTIACITGGIAEAYYGGVPPEIEAEVLARLDPPLRAVVESFRLRHSLNTPPLREK